MPTGLVGRDGEFRLVGDFLSAATTQPMALVIDGEPGIGKTTLWSAAVDEARSRGFQLLTARAASAESVLAYTSLADMLDTVEPAILAKLPTPQRNAIDNILLRETRAANDQRALAAGFLSIVKELAATAPVSIAIDDLQWIDPSSRLIVAFAARRLSGPVGMLATVRTEDIAKTDSRPTLGRPENHRQISLAPLSVGALHAMIVQRLDRSFPRPTMVRIADVSGGNPFFALELARAVATGRMTSEWSLPPTLTDLVHSKIHTGHPGTSEALLAAACLAIPTVRTVARACETTPDDVVALLQAHEDRGVVEIAGDQLRYRHPIYALGVYHEAGAGRRRAMHRRLAGIVEEPELAAKHLALGTARGDALTLQSLDTAAESARRRGAPVAAAELVSLAIGLGGDTPQRRIRLAHHHFSAGDPALARTLLEDAVADLPPGTQRAEALALLGYVRVLDDSFPEAVGLLEGALSEAVADPAVLVPMLVTLSFALFNAGRLDPAVERADEAIACAEKSRIPGLIAQALSMRSMVGFLRGEGVDDAALHRACELEDPDATYLSVLRPRVHSALLHSCSGNLDVGHSALASLRQECLDRGEDGELMLISFHAVLTDVWRGRFSDAEVIVADVVERAEQLGGHLPMLVALTSRALLCAYAGREAETRRDVAAAMSAARLAGSDRLAEWPATILGFLEVSLGDHGAALTALAPLLQKFDRFPEATEIIAASYIPDAVEALAHLDRCDTAEPLVTALERNGQRLGRAWMLAVGGRCRAILLAAQGDVAAAATVAQAALGHHDELPMPFERARTELLVGQLHRRQRRKDAAASTLTAAAASFERLGTPLWSTRARTELARVRVRTGNADVLTESERRVAELAATGMTIKKVAATLFISPKTVEATLSRVYSKLGIHSRAELGRHMGRLNP